mgnify:FL=1
MSASRPTYELGPNGTAIEGPWDDVLSCVRLCHETLHGMGAPRIYSTLKLNTRIDRSQSFLEKVSSVERALEHLKPVEIQRLTNGAVSS